MAKTIKQRVVFKNVKPETLYAMYLDAQHHSAFTGGDAKITSNEGENFSVHGGYVTGKNLQLEEGKLIVQSWFGSDWKNWKLDSTFVLLFEKKGRDTILHMTHANIPDKHAAAIQKGWTEYYWKPWKKYLSMIQKKSK